MPEPVDLLAALQASIDRAKAGRLTTPAAPEPDPSTLIPCPCRKPRECSNWWLEQGRYCQRDAAGCEGETW